MVELTLLRTSPLAGLTHSLMEGAVTGARHVRVLERRFTTMVSLRARPATPAADALGGVLGTPLPLAAGEVTSLGPHAVLWQGPDEWLVVSQTAAEVLVPLLADAVAGAHAAVVDVSANRTVLELEGAAAREVLQKGCPVDLHPRALGPGRAVSTTLARIPLVLWQVRPDAYWLLPRASLAGYIARWLLDASTEFASRFHDAGNRG